MVIPVDYVRVCVCMMCVHVCAYVCMCAYAHVCMCVHVRVVGRWWGTRVELGPESVCRMVTWCLERW